MHPTMAAVLRGIYELRQEFGYNPNYREIGRRIGLNHVSVGLWVWSLIAVGYIRAGFDADERVLSRSIEVTEQGLAVLGIGLDAGVDG